MSYNYSIFVLTFPPLKKHANGWLTIRVFLFVLLYHAELKKKLWQMTKTSNPPLPCPNMEHGTMERNMEYGTMERNMEHVELSQRFYTHTNILFRLYILFIHEETEMKIHIRIFYSMTLNIINCDTR